MTCNFEPDGRNVVDDYLKRRAWKEPAAIKRYLEALRRSTMSVYEVIDTTPGSHFVVRDLVRGGEPAGGRQAWLEERGPVGSAGSTAAADRGPDLYGRRRVAAGL